MHNVDMNCHTAVYYRTVRAVKCTHCTHSTPYNVRRTLYVGVHYKNVAILTWRGVVLLHLEVSHHVWVTPLEEVVAILVYTSGITRNLSGANAIDKMEVWRCFVNKAGIVRYTVLYVVRCTMLYVDRCTVLYVVRCTMFYVVRCTMFYVVRCTICTMYTVHCTVL